jgi:hypothetical protein
MKVKVVRSFVDRKSNNRLRPAGQTVEFDEERVKDLVERGLVCVIEEEAEKPKGKVSKPKEEA